ncbi:hypothetical protein [Streptomyces alboniger]|uniref:hypothetical protein n=1 Tax=Streptomyces alboniger TaxID=132473 RepID=UPI000A554C29|nr:hypothetical protein [Streptomyces alboniger]
MSDVRRNVLPTRPGEAAAAPGDGVPGSSTPIYDALVRQWRAQCREVPRPPTTGGDWVRADPQDLFRRG